MNKDLIIEYLKSIEDMSYKAKINLYNNDYKEAYITLLCINKTLSNLFYRIATEPTAREVKP